MYNPKQLELDILKLWEENKIFEKRRKKNESNDKWSFIDGPVTANYDLGVHTAYSRVLKDLYQRFKGLQGFHQRYQNGFDCHGLPVEVGVEKEEKIDIKIDLEKYGLNNFIEKCRQRVDKYSKRQVQQSIRLGQWMDWGNDYYTMSDNNISHIWYFLKKCHEKGWIYKGSRVLPWCYRCGTSLSQHEQTDSYSEKKHDSVFLKFPIKGRKNEFLVVWTTTPWTLTANTAVAVCSDLTYVKAKKGNDIYYIAEACVDILGEGVKILEKLEGRQLVGIEYTGPFADLEAQKDVKARVVEWKEVSETTGSGIVHIAPGCGAEDHELGKEKGLDVLAPLDEQGNYIQGYGWLIGKNVEEVTEPIIADLKKRNYLIKKEKILHRYPHCWRCKTDLIFRLSKEWFIKVDEIRPLLIKEAKKIVWSPSYGSRMMEDWLNTMGDWNISRKRYWGIPLPIWVCECGKIEVMGSLEELKKKAVSGVDQLKELHVPWVDNVKLKCKCGKEMTRVPEVGDCWLDAGIVPYSTLNYLTDKEHWKEWFPAELIAEMREQVRLWFYSMLFMSVTLEGVIPYNKVILFEEVRAESGEAMHKSGENVIWIDEAFGEIGADVLRWVYLRTNLNKNILFGFKLAKEVNQTLSYLINIATYVDKFLKDKPGEVKVSKIEDKWFLSKLEETKKEATKALEELKPYIAVNLIEDFFVNTFSKQYIKYIRNRTDDKEVVNLMYKALLETLQLISPFSPFLPEDLYQKYFRKHEKEESIHLLNWPGFDESKIDKKLEERMENAALIIEGVSNLRNKVKVNLRQPLSDIIVIMKEPLEELSELIAVQSNVKKVIFGEAPISGYEEYESPNFKVFLNIEITPELKKEGLTREVIRRIQSMRRDLGLVESDVIEVNVIGDIEVISDMIQKQTNTSKLHVGSRLLQGQEKKWKIGGKEITIIVKK